MVFDVLPRARAPSRLLQCPRGTEQITELRPDCPLDLLGLEAHLRFSDRLAVITEMQIPVRRSRPIVRHSETSLPKGVEKTAQRITARQRHDRKNDTDPQIVGDAYAHADRGENGHLRQNRRTAGKTG
jgi:hypothetical protein